MSRSTRLFRLQGMNVLILGGGYAGLTAAVRLARLGKKQVQVTLVNDGPELVERIRLHQLAAGQALRKHAIARLLAGTAVRFIDARVEHIDLSAHTANGTLAWDALLLALGSRTDTSLPGVREHALTLDAAHAATVATRLSSARQVTVVGGGLTGVEAASELAEQHPSLRVRLVTRGALLPGFSEAAVAHTRKALERLHVTVCENTSVREVRAKELVTDSGPLEHDLCLWSAGFRAAALPSGLESLASASSGQVVVDDALRARGRSDVWVCGDLASSPTRPFTQGCKSAGPSAAWAVDNLLATMRGEAPRPFRYFAPYFCVSLGRRDGFLQKALPDGRLLGPVLATGWRGAFIKELICKSTVWQIGLERRGWSSYRLFEARPDAALAPGFTS